jgi:3-oxoacyl-[acyl-carrier protein] reductase
MTLPQRTALVTGGSRGIGRAVCLRLARDGAAVAVNYRQNRELAENLTAEIRAAGGRALAVEADITNVWHVNAMVKMIDSELGPIDILVNNAGVFEPGELDTADPAALERMRHTNVDGLLAVTRAVTGGMKFRGYGRIINLTSIAARGTSLPGTTLYAATKAAVTVLTKRLALDLGPYGITVNAVAPGFIVTEMATQGRSAEEMEKVLAEVSARAMVRRTGTTEDVAHAIAFLASEESGFITAQVLTVDGGRTDYLS